MSEENKHVRAARAHVEIESRIGRPTFVGDTMRGLLAEIDRLSNGLSNADGPDCQKGTQWRYMADAPRDGTKIDIWAFGRRHMDCTWGEVSVGAHPGNRAWVDCERYVIGAEQARGWIPSPTDFE